MKNNIIVIILFLMMLVAPAFALTTNTCIDANTLESNTTITVDGVESNINQETNCPYGCYTDRCNTPPTKDVMSMVYVAIFIMLIGFVSLYVAFKRDALMWSVISTVIFLSNTLYTSGIPFEVNAIGGLVGTSANFILIGVSFIFTIIGLLLSFKFGFELLDMM